MTYDTGKTNVSHKTRLQDKIHEVNFIISFNWTRN